MAALHTMLTTFADAPTLTRTLTITMIAASGESTAAWAPPVKRPASPKPALDCIIREPWVPAVVTKATRSEEAPVLVVPVARLEKLEELRATLQGLSGQAKNASTVDDLLGANFESERGLSVRLRRTAGAAFTFSERARIAIADRKGQHTEAAAYRLMLRREDGRVVEVRLSLTVGRKGMAGQPVGILQLMATSPIKTNADYLVLEQLRQSFAQTWSR